jgi:hypothetical protein
MTPVKLQILGNFWDCQIYRGRLYLFGMDGSIRTINWNNLIESFHSNGPLDIALTYAFKNGRNLYHPELHELFKDEEIKELLKSKFERLSERNLIISEENLDVFQIGQQDSPFNELHVDSEIFTNRLYVLSHNALLSSTVHGKSKKYPVTTNVKKHFDLYAFSMRANKYARLALSAGNDGLLEYNASATDFIPINDDRRIIQVSDRHSSFADYSFLSIYNSSLYSNSFLSYFTWNNSQSTPKPEKVKKGEFEEDQIFKGNQDRQPYLSWGSNEKIYRAVQGGIEMVRFNNYAKEDDSIFSEAKLIPLQNWKGNVLSAYTAYFGTILHCENAVVVMLSDGTYYNIPGEASRVRIFPRSLNYENHLHVILDDRLEIYSFNNDYFVDQKSKDFGFAFRQPKTFGFVRGGYASRYESDEKFYDFDSEVNTKENTDSLETPLDTEDLPF